MSLFAITPDNRYTISVDNYRLIYVTETETMSTVHIIEQNIHKVIYLRAFPDNQHFVIVDRTRYGKDEAYLRVFDLQSGECINVYTLKVGGVGEPFITPDSRYVIFTTEFQYSVAIWDWQGESELRILFSQGIEECFIDILTSDGSSVVVTHYPAISPPVIKSHKNPVLRIWDLQTGQNIHSFPGYKNAKALPYKHKILATMEETGNSAILDIEDGQIDFILNAEQEKRIVWLSK